MQKRSCPSIKSKKALKYPQKLKCDPVKGHWMPIDGGVPCYAKSKYKNDPNYYCDALTGRYTPIKGMKREFIEGAPRKPLTAYFIWMPQVYPSFKLKHPGATSNQLAKLMGTEWNRIKNSNDPMVVEAHREAELAHDHYIDQVDDFKSGNRYTKFTQIVKKPQYSNGHYVNQWNRYYQMRMSELKGNIYSPEKRMAIIRAEWFALKKEGLTPYIVTTEPVNVLNLQETEKLFTFPE